MNREIFRKDTKIILYVVIALIIVIIGSSYALFFEVKKNESNQVVRAGSLKFTYVNGTEITSSSKSYCFEPMSDERAETLTNCVYELSVQNTGSLISNYSLSINTNNSNTLETSKMKVILKKEEQGTNEVVEGYPKVLSTLDNGTLISESIAPNTTIVYQVQIYIPEDLVSYSDNNKIISLNINGVGEVTDNQYTVTFDPDGGTLAALTKEVVYGEPYGELPTPTKTGYTFKGWNGKNLFNIEDSYTNENALIVNDVLYMDASNVSGNRGSYITLQTWNNSTHVSDFNRIGYIGFKETGKYCISFKVEEINFDYFNFLLNTNLSDPRLGFKSNINANAQYVFSFNILESDFPNAKVTINKIQLEEGTEATAYEPYFITSDTTVVQAKNHTIKAIWEKNE